MKPSMLAARFVTGPHVLAPDKAEQILGLRWTPLAHGLAGTADWYLRGGRT